MGYFYLMIAIMSEVMGTSMLKLSDGFTNLIPSTLCIIGYGVSFYFLSLVLKIIPIGVSYAIWSGVGIVLISIVGLFLFDQQLDVPAILGISLIISGVFVIHLFSKTVQHWIEICTAIIVYLWSSFRTRSNVRTLSGISFPK